jgi:S-adenosylmethionine:tRNA-ribosyltransferase-isomerase (queuine synthetase)
MNTFFDQDVFIVNQNPKSKYDDKEGLEYEYPTKIPNGKNIKKGDLLIFNLSKKVAASLKLGNATISGIARVNIVTIFQKNGKQMAKASYSWYRKFNQNVSFEEIGGDVRNNKNNSINRIPFEKSFELLLEVLKIK